MVLLDHSLINRARRLMTGANVHRVEELISAYEQAVMLHNEGSPGDVIYQGQYENDLRRFSGPEKGRLLAFPVAAWKNNPSLDKRNHLVMQRASEAVQRAQLASSSCRNLDDRIEADVLRRKKKRKGN